MFYRKKYVTKRVFTFNKAEEQFFFYDGMGLAIQQISLCTKQSRALIVGVLQKEHVTEWVWRLDRFHIA